MVERDLPSHRALPPHEHLILKNQFQKLSMAETVAAGLVQTHVKRFGQARKTQLAQRG